MNDIIGKYRGIKVYKVTLPEYVNGRLYKDEENMYLIDGELIYKNEIFAKYDGNYVSELDAHLRREFYTVPAIKVRTPEKPSTSSIGMDEGDSYSDSETKTEDAVVFSNFEFKTVDEILDSSFGSFATEMTDAVACAPALADAFLKNALES